jgi:hypothetical protein
MWLHQCRAADEIKLDPNTLSLINAAWAQVQSGKWAVAILTGRGEIVPLKHNEDGASRPHCLAKMISASGLGSNHRYDSQRAGIHDKNFIADQDILKTAILRGIFNDRNRQPIKMNCSWNDPTNRGWELHVGQTLGLFATQRAPNFRMLFG